MRRRTTVIGRAVFSIFYFFLRTRGYAQATTAPSLCISILQASIWKHYEANAVCRLACRAMSAAKPTGDSDAAALLYPPAPTCARPSSLRARDSYRRSTGSKVACGRAVASESQVSLSFWPRPGSSGRLQLSRRSRGSARSCGRAPKALTMLAAAPLERGRLLHREHKPTPVV